MNQISNTFLVAWLMSPLSRWHQSSPLHKLVSLAAGASAGYYLHTRKGWGMKKAAAAGLGTAYGTSMVMHAPKVMAMAGAAQAAALPQQQAMPSVITEPAPRPVEEVAEEMVQSNVVPFPEKEPEQKTGT